MTAPAPGVKADVRAKPVAPNALSPLSVPAYAAFWAASLLSNILSMMQGVGLAWFLMSISDSPTLIAGLQTAACLPIIFLSFFAGAVADSVDRRIVMGLAQLTLMSTSVVLAGAAALRLDAEWLILALAALAGAALAFYAPAAQAALMSLVPRDKVAAAVGLGSLSYNLSRTLGPALGGLLVAGFGPAPVIGLGALGSLALCVVIAWWKPAVTQSPLPPEPIFEGIHTGARFIVLSPGLLGILLRTGLFGLCAGVLLSFPPLVARHLLDGGPAISGLLLAAFGAGAIGSAFVSARIRHVLAPARMALFSGLGVAVSLIVIGANLNLALTLISFASAGAAWVAFLSPLTVSVQMHAPEWMAGRAAASFQIVLAAGLALGSPLWGALAQHIGVAGALLAAGGVLAVLLFQTRTAPMPALDDQDTTPLYELSTTSPEINTSMGEGRIVVTNEYRVAHALAAEFKAAAEDLGRLRARDGARRWMLLQDLADPELWVERYESINWTEHLRRLLRPTKADQAIRDQVHRLSGGAVHTRRFIQKTSDAAPNSAQTKCS